MKKNCDIIVIVILWLRRVPTCGEGGFTFSLGVEILDFDDAVDKSRDSAGAALTADAAAADNVDVASADAASDRNLAST